MTQNEKLKLSPEEKANYFKKEGEKIFEGRYTYDKITEINTLEQKVECYCVKHNNYFLQACTRHLEGRLSCKECLKERKVTILVRNTSSFIKQSNIVHDNFYNYDKTNYINCYTKVIITCPIHGDFEQLPGNHLSGYKCAKCAHSHNYSTDEWIEKAIKKHGDKFDYSLTEYINLSTPIKCKCNRCGETLTQSPGTHIDHGCPNCQRLSFGITKEDLIEKANIVHNKQYDYSLITTTSLIFMKDKITIICPKHGVFEQTVYAHLKGAKCIKCANNIMTSEEAIEKFRTIHGDRYDYSKVDYKTRHKNICIICPKHGEFWQEAGNHFKGKGCPVCKQSHLENEIMMLLINNNIEYETQKRFDWLGLQSLDFYLPQFNVGIECQGEQHFKETRFSGHPKKRLIDIKRRDGLKKQLCNENKIKLLYYSNLGIDYPYHIFENKDELLKEIVSN